MTPEAEIAIESVKESNKRYYLAALSFAIEFCKTMMKPFSSEDLKEAYHQVAEPAREPRVWGAVMKELQKLDKIAFHSYGIYRASQGHGRPCTYWISKQYSLKQSQNASSRIKTDYTSNGQIRLI